MAEWTIEYIGGPRDGERAVLGRSGPKAPFAFPLEIQILEVDEETKVERRIGTYTRDHANPDGVMRYLWSHRGAHAAKQASDTA